MEPSRPITEIRPAPWWLPWLTGAGAAAWGAWFAAPYVAMRDAGELTTAAAALDVAHPTGFPFDLAVMRLAMLSRGGSIAFRANLVMALWAGVFSALLSLVVATLLGGTRVPRIVTVAVAVASPVVLLASRTVVHASTAVEVYAPSLAAGLAAMLALAQPGRSARTQRVLAALLGLSFAMHTGARPALLVAFVALFARDVFATRRIAPRSLAAALACAVVGALPVLYLPVSARRHGPIDWGHPATLAALWDHLSAQRIRDAYAYRMFVPWRVPGDLAHVARIVAEDLGVLVPLAAVASLVLAPRRRATWGIAAIVAADVLYATLVNPMGVGDRQTLFVAEGGLVALGAAGAAMLVALLPSRTVVPVGLIVAAFAAAGRDWVPASRGRSDGWSATEILGGAGALGAVPPRSIVLCESDDVCGVALYEQIVEGERPDVLVIPRQHLGLETVWSHVEQSVFHLHVPAPPAGVDPRTFRLRAIVAQVRDRVRWDPGGTDDERLLPAPLSPAETCVLPAVGMPPTDADEHAIAWLQRRTPQGDGARTVAAHVLVSTARRLLAGLAGGTMPIMERTLWAALEFDREQVAARVNLAVMRWSEHRGPEAIALLREAVAIDPERLTAWRNLSRYLAASGDGAGADAARAEYERRSAR